MGGQLVREGYSRTGAGVVTPDGCAVEPHTRLAVGVWARAVPFQGPYGGQWMVLKLRQGLASAALTSENVVAR